MAEQNAGGPPEPVVLPIPPDFPVTWGYPKEQEAPWEFDPMHFPDPFPLLEAEFLLPIFEKGMSPGFASYELPVQALGHVFNNYIYMAMVPAVPLEEMEAQGKRAEENLGATIARLQERWHEEWLPAIKTHLAFWESFDLENAALPDLLTHFDASLEHSNDLWNIHFQIVTPVYTAMGLLDEIYRELFEDENVFASYQLLEGFDNKTIETNRALWDLSRSAAQTDAVRAILANNASDAVLAALQESAEGQVFLQELRAFLAEYGQRGPTWSLSQPSWIEDPTPAIKNLQDYIDQPEADPRVQQATLVGEREQAVTTARHRLAGYPEQAVGQFEFLLKAAQAAIVLTEDHGFWIDFKAMYKVRRVLVEVGQRFVAAGALENANDVFYLNTDEVHQAAAALPQGDLRALVDQRKAELEHNRSLTPPHRLGTDYGPPPDSPLSRSFGKFFGLPIEPQEDQSLLKGNAGSPGKVQGPAKVVRSLAEAEKLTQGDILVADTTSPPWTPLFSTAAAIVTDTGGILSHCAVVAREYRIPAVVGTGTATSTLKDGQILEVDGDNGIVKIVG